MAVTSGTSHLVSLSELPERQFGQNSSRILFPYSSVHILDALCLVFFVYLCDESTLWQSHSLSLYSVYILEQQLEKMRQCFFAKPAFNSTLSASVERYR